MPISATSWSWKYARQHRSRIDWTPTQGGSRNFLETQRSQLEKPSRSWRNLSNYKRPKLLRLKGRWGRSHSRNWKPKPKVWTKKAEAMKKNADSHYWNGRWHKLPEIARAVAEPLTKLLIRSPCTGSNASKMVGDIMQSIDQVSRASWIWYSSIASRSPWGWLWRSINSKKGELVIEAEELASKED